MTKFTDRKNIFKPRSVTAMLLAVLVASTSILPAFSDGGDIHLINDLGEYGGQTSIEEQTERDWNEDIVAVAKGAWLDAHAGEDRERTKTSAASPSELDMNEAAAATGSNLAGESSAGLYDVFEDVDDQAVSGKVLSYLKKAGKKEKEKSGSFLRSMLKEAVIPEEGVPRENVLKKEILALYKMNDEDYDVFRTDREYTPVAGDIIFLAGHIAAGEGTPATASNAGTAKDDGRIVPMTVPTAVEPIVIENATPSDLAPAVPETEVTLPEAAALAGDNSITERDLPENTASAEEKSITEGAVPEDTSSAAENSSVEKEDKQDEESISPETDNPETEPELTEEELQKKLAAEKEKALRRNAKHTVLAGIIIAGLEDTASDYIRFIYSTDADKVEIGAISKNEVRIIGYADMEQLHDKYCGILEELEDSEEEQENAEELEEAPAVPNEKTEYIWKNDTLTVTAVLTDPEAVPDDAELVVTPVTKKTEGYNYQAYMDALTGEIASADEDHTILYDVAFLVDEKDENGEPTGRRIELQPENDKVRVSFKFNNAQLTESIGAKDAEKLKVVHLSLGTEAKENADTTKDAVDIASGDITPSKLDASVAIGSKSGKVEFETEGFSVFAIVYTVDFEYEVNGKMYQFSLPGGGFVSFTDLVEVLGILDDTKNDGNKEEKQEEIDATDAQIIDGMLDVTASDAAKKFVADVASVEFSSPELVWVGKVENATTVGALKEANGLECEYSADLTEEQIAEINAQTVGAGDWALISGHPFTSEESLTVTMKNGEVFTIKVTDAQNINGATVHYGYMAGNTFHEFTSDQFTPPTSGFGRPAYLIYDVPGYQYAGTTYYYRNNITDMRYASTTAPIIERNSSGHYYVTYEPRPAAAQAGSSSAANNYPEEPTVTKTSVENPSTGTNTISLEVQGKRKTAKQKADIIVIYDVSGSMKFPISFNSLTDVPAGVDATRYFLPDNNPNQRNYIVKGAVKNLANELMQDNSGNDPAVRMAIVPFSTGVGNIVPFTGNASAFGRAVDSLQLNGGTNWEAALQAANALDVRLDADTYVIFVTDGNPTFRITRGDATDNQITSSDNLPGVTRYYYDDLGIFGTGNADTDKTSKDSLDRNYQAALAIARLIVGDETSSKRLYGIGISPEAYQLEDLIGDSGSSGEYFEVKDKPSDIDDAIDAIKQQIKELTFGYSDVQITDGITDLSQTVQKTGMTTLPDSDDFEYYKGHAATQEDVTAGKAAAVGETVWEPWTKAQMEEEGAGRASYNSSTGAVEWNLGETFMLEEGVSYKVDFTVWPSQEALDILADINNSCRRDSTTGELTTYASPDAAYESLPDDVKGQIYKHDGKYVLKTNEDTAGYTYRKATKEEPNGVVTPKGEPIGDTFPRVIPLNLRTDKIGVEKSFSNLLDSRDPTQISLELWGDRLFKTFTLTKDGQWKSDDNFISCGLLTVDKSTGEVYIYETGHDFTLKETGEDSIYWELTADTYHPMIINDVLHMLSKVNAPAGMSADAKYYSAGGKEYYRIGNEVYVDEGTDAVLKAVNDHRSFLDLSKEVVDESGNKVDDDTLFTFKAKFVEARVDDDIIFTVYDTVNKKYIDDLDTTAVLTPADDETNKTPYYKVADGTEFTLKIKQGWNVRFLNLSNETTYTIEELLAGTDYDLVSITDGAVKKTTGGGSTSVDTHMTITSGSTQMSGTIAEANVLYSLKYTNREKPKTSVTFQKAWSGASGKDDTEVTYTLFQIAEPEAGGEPVYDNVYVGTCKVGSETKTGTATDPITFTVTKNSPVTVSGLPISGVIGTTPVIYKYYAVEADVEGFAPDSPDAVASGTFTITNKPIPAAATFEDVQVEKNWAGDGADQIGGYRFKLIQERAELSTSETQGSGAFHPITIRTVDGDGTQHDTVYYVAAGKQISITATKKISSGGTCTYSWGSTRNTVSSTTTVDTGAPMGGYIRVFKLEAGKKWGTDWTISAKGKSSNNDVSTTPKTFISKLNNLSYNPIDGFEVKVNVPTATTAFVDGNAYTATAANWKATVQNLPYYYYDSAAKKYYTYRYKVQEVSIIKADGTELEAVTNNADGTGGESAHFTVTYDNSGSPLKITNTLKDTFELNILKVDKNSPATPLKGASFQIRKLVGTNASTFETDSTFTIVSETTGAEGTVKFENLPAGIYEIEETAQPAGYVLANFKGKAYIKVESGGIRLLKSEAGKAPNSWGELPVTDTDADYLTIEASTLTVKNEPGAALPNTGGIGTHLFTILGSILILGAGILYVRRRRLFDC